MSSHPAWMISHLHSRPPFTQVLGERVDAWNVAHWTPGGFNIVAGAHDRHIAQRVRDEYVDEGYLPASAIVVRGGTSVTPRYLCPSCKDWGTVIAPDGHGTVPCPTCKGPQPAPAGPQQGGAK